MNTSIPVQFQQFEVVPQGLVQSGNASYIFDPNKGSVSYHANLKVGEFFFTKDEAFQGIYNTDPATLLSSGIASGKKLAVGQLQMEVAGMAPDTKQATVHVSVTGQNVTGILMLDLSKTYVSILSLNAKGTVLGYDFTLVLQPV